MTWLWILAIVAQSADASLTCRQMQRGARELNPFLGQSCGQVIAMKTAAMGIVPLLPESKQKWALGALAVGGSVGVTVTIALK